MANRSCTPGRRSAAVRMVFFTVLLLFAVVSVRAENNCPWMNEATASDVVGGEATGAYVVNGGKSSACTFIQQNGNKRRTLEIRVRSSGDPHSDYLVILKAHCGSASMPLKAIGNEAATCSIRRRRKVTGELALGRVRDQVFIISLRTSIKSDPMLTPAMLEMKAWTAAELVAGNLF